MSELKVNSIKGVAASAAAITLNNTDGTCTANLTNRTNKNLVVNGSCLVAQRGLSNTTNGYGTVDRMRSLFGGTDENVTQAQVDVASGTTPYTLGFRKAFKMTNGNQTSIGTNDNIHIQIKLEAQDLANSGWNYTSTSSFVTFSFWCKSSVAQNFYGYLRSIDGTGQLYPFETGILTADTWTKVTKTIPGNSNLQFDNNNGEGIQIVPVAPFFGTAFTDPSVSLNAWGAYSTSARMPDNTTTWYTTNDATFEITGVQLEVGSVATDFEHRSYADTLLKCQRYYQVLFDATKQNTTYWQQAYYYNTSTLAFIKSLVPEMRATPSLECTSTSGVYRAYRGGSYNSINTFFISHSSSKTARIYTTGSFGSVSGYGAGLYVSSGTNEMIALSAEL